MKIIISEKSLYSISGFFIIFYKLYSVGLNYNKYNFSQKDFINFNMKLVGLVHTIFICFNCYYFTTGKLDEDTFLERFDISKGYFIFDIFCMLYYRNHIIDFEKLILHHLILILGLHSDKFALYPQFVSQGFFAEITNIPLLLGWFLIKKGKQNTILFYTNAFLLLLSFFIYRVYNFTDLFVKSLNLTEKYYEMAFVFIIAILNIIWFIKLLDKFFKTLLGRS